MTSAQTHIQSTRWELTAVDPAVAAAVTLAEAEVARVQASLELARRGTAKPPSQPSDISLLGRRMR
jgi:hypothetical protein